MGLFSDGGNGVGKGLFYGGGLSQLGIQLLGLIVVDAYVLAVMFVIFKVIDKAIGLRVPAEVEIDGLDIHEHGLASAYAGFAISDANSAAMVPNENTDLGEDNVSKASAKQMDAAVPVAVSYTHLPCYNGVNWTKGSFPPCMLHLLHATPPCPTTAAAKAA